MSPEGWAVWRKQEAVRLKLCVLARQVEWLKQPDRVGKIGKAVGVSQRKTWWARCWQWFSGGTW